jgi:Spy/CpxP family protein refolding chaperone
MKLRRVTYTILALALLATYACAQRDSSMMARRVDRLTTALTLTPEQVTKVRAIYAKSFAEGAAAREKFQDDPDGMQKAMRERQQKTDTQIDSLLTADQKPKFEQFKKERMNGRMGRPPGGGN